MNLPRLNLSALKPANVATALQPHIITVKNWCAANKPTLCCLGGIACSFAATAEAISATKRAQLKISDKEAEIGRELTKWERFGTALPCYIPTGLTLMAGTGIALYGNALHLSKTAAAVAAAGIAERKSENLEQAIRERFGDNEAEKTKELAAKKEGEALLAGTQPPSEASTGMVLFVDSMMGSHFYAKPEWVDRAEILVNKECQKGAQRSVTVNEFYKNLVDMGVNDESLFLTGIGGFFGWNEENILNIRKVWDDDPNFGIKKCVLTYNLVNLDTLNPVWNVWPYERMKKGK